MGVITFNEEIPCSVAPHRMFHAMFVDSHNFIPKIMPNVVKSIDFISGDGSPGSVQQINFAEGSPVKYLKNRLDLEDKANNLCKYTVIESDAFGDRVDHICNEVKFDHAPDGKSIFKSKSIYHPKGDTVLTEEECKGGKEQSIGVYKSVEKYLVENPSVYA